MSEYSQTKTEFKDGELLVAALRELGFQPTNTIGNPQPLYGYMGDFRTMDGEGHTRDPKLAMRADIIIPKSQVGGSSNDIGFVRQADGKYSAIISAYDSRQYNTKWLNGVKVKVGEVGIERQAKRMGLRLAGKKVVNGKLQFQYIKG